MVKKVRGSDVGTPSNRITTAQIAPLRSELLAKQNYVCPLCKGSMRGGTKTPALDHDHKTGYIRDVLCFNCNGIEGKIFNLARRAKNKMSEVQWLSNWADYHKRHQSPKHGGILHPKHKTADEKRLATNAKARKKRKALKK